MNYETYWIKVIACHGECGSYSCEGYHHTYPRETREHMGVRDFGWALMELRAGKKVTRPGWNGKGMWLALQVPDANSKMSLPYIYLKTVDDKLVPWLPSQTDVLATDWELAE